MVDLWCEGSRVVSPLIPGYNLGRRRKSDNDWLGLGNYRRKCSNGDIKKER